MSNTQEVGFIVSYVIFISVMLFFTPAFFPGLFNITNEDIDQITTVAEANIFQVVINFINNTITNFVVLTTLTVTSTNIFAQIIGIFVGGYTVGAFVVLLKIIAEALP